MIVDPNRWFTGTIVSEDAFTLVVLSEGKEIEVAKGRVLRIERLRELPKPQPGVISLRDGSILQCTIHADEFEGVTYSIAGVRNVLPRDEVFAVTLLPSVEDRLAQWKKSIAPGDLSRLLQVCHWLLQEDRPDLALAELETLLAAHPGERSVQELLSLARHSLPAASDDGPAESERRAEPNNPYLGRVLTPDEVNLIRVFEVDLADPPRLSIDPSTVRELLSHYASSKLVPSNDADRQRLIEADPVEVLRLMFALRAREFYSRVKVVTEPTSLRLFNRSVYSRWLIPNCATSNCHGGMDAGDFLLHTERVNAAEVRTTNLLTVLRKSFDGVPLIDWGSPHESLLLQYALPRHLARTPHPAVKGWTPALGRDPERMATETEIWIRSMYQPRPDYMVDWDPPARPVLAPDDPANAEVR